MSPSRRSVSVPAGPASGGEGMTRRNWKRLLAAGAVALAAYGGWGMAFPGRAFDAVAWQDEDQIRDGVRLGMADRLVARGTLRGKTRAEVVEVLGEPPPTAYFGGWDLVYWLGPERGFFSIDSEWLVVRLGEGERVAEYHIARD